MVEPRPSHRRPGTTGHYFPAGRVSSVQMAPADPLGPLDALRSAGTVARDVLAGRLRHGHGRLGAVLETDAGQRFVVYRATVREPGAAADPAAGAVLAFRFHLRFTPRPVRPLAVRVFEPLSLLTTPFVAGLPGFQRKLWLVDHDTGDYMGVYGWADAAAAERYAWSLRRLMDARSVPGSVAYEVHADVTVDEFVRVRRVDAPTA